MDAPPSFIHFCAFMHSTPSHGKSVHEYWHSTGRGPVWQRKRKYIPVTLVHLHLEGSGVWEPRAGTSLPEAQQASRQCSPWPCQGGSLCRFSRRGEKGQNVCLHKNTCRHLEMDWSRGWCRLDPARRESVGQCPTMTQIIAKVQPFV